jgi:hypothetical protein
MDTVSNEQKTGMEPYYVDHAAGEPGPLAGGPVGIAASRGAVR